MKKAPSKSKRAAKIILNVFGVALLVFVGVELIYKFTGSPFYLFNRRYDVVLTDSMSTKNAEAETFLEGHDNQIQPFDFVVSERVGSNDELNVYDIVLFDNPRIGTDMHRVVEKKTVGTEFTFSHLKKETVFNAETIAFGSTSSSIATVGTCSFKSFEMVTYSDNRLAEDYYYYNINYVQVAPKIESREENGHYVNKVTFERDSSSPVPFSLTKRNYEVGDHIASIKLSGETRDYVVQPSLLNGSEEQSYFFYPEFRYKIRGDKAKLSEDDGWYKMDQIYSRVVYSVPKIGHFFHFISSIWGTILIIGLGIIAILFGIFMDNHPKDIKTEESQK